MAVTQVTMLTITITMHALNNNRLIIASGMQNCLEEARLAKRDFFYIQTLDVVTVFLIIQASVQDHDACFCGIAFGKHFQCTSQSMFEMDRSIVSSCYSLPTCCYQDKYTITFLV